MLTPSQFKVRLHMSTLSKSDSTRGYRLRLVAASSEPIEVGGMIGRLQVGCCAPPRMPLYAEALSYLNTIQLEVDRELGRHAH